MEAWLEELARDGHKADPPAASAAAERPVRARSWEAIAREAFEQRDRALAERDHARDLACLYEEKLALIRRAAAARRTHV